jgi:hypothetical protein
VTGLTTKASATSATATTSAIPEAHSDLWSQGRSCPPRVKFLPCGWNSLFTPPFFWIEESVHCWGWTKGWTFPLGDKFHPWGPGVK